MVKRPQATSPKPYARIAGASYLMNILLFAPGVLIYGRIVVPDNAAATAANILQHANLIRLGFACNLLGTCAYVAVTALFYRLFAPVSRIVSLLAAWFSLIGCAVLAVACLFYLAPAFVLADAHALSGFSPEQGQALGLVLVQLYVQCFNISFVFFACYCLLIGWLIFRSGFLPRVLGVGMALAGTGYLTFFSPPLAHALAPYNVLPGSIGEGALTLWLLFAGVDAARWQARAAEAGGSGGG